MEKSNMPIVAIVGAGKKIGPTLVANFYDEVEKSLPRQTTCVDAELVVEDQLKKWRIRE